MTFVKVCGITNLDDALQSVEAGADALGFNFYKPSSRYVEPALARKIIEQMPASVLTFGVFVNESAPETLDALAKEAGIQAVQLHGDESPQYCSALNHFYVMKALSVKPGFDEQIALQYKTDAVMLDTSHKRLRGGTGQTFDWSIAKVVNDLGVRLFLAGGLSPENVRDAIRTVRPYAVDACSALEKVAGKKDPKRVRQFIAAVRSVEDA